MFWLQCRRVRVFLGLHLYSLVNTFFLEPFHTFNCVSVVAVFFFTSVSCEKRLFCKHHAGSLPSCFQHRSLANENRNIHRERVCKNITQVLLSCIYPHSPLPLRAECHTKVDVVAVTGRSIKSWEFELIQNKSLIRKTTKYLNMIVCRGHHFTTFSIFCLSSVFFNHNCTLHTCFIFSSEHIWIKGLCYYYFFPENIIFCMPVSTCPLNTANLKSILHSVITQGR